MNTISPANRNGAKPSTMTIAGIRKGKIQMPLRVLVYGAEGCGKTTFCAGAPKPILLGVESGSMNVDIDRLPEPKTWQDILDGVALLENEKHDYETLAIDPLNWAEALVFAHLTGGNGSIEDFNGGYGKGYTAALDQWRVLLAGLERLWRKGMHVLLTAHSQVKSFANPEGAAYDRYEIAMNTKASGLVKQWTDFVLFARFEAFAKVDTKTKRANGFSTGARVAHTSWQAAFDAKSRLKLPDELPLSWQAFWDAVQAESSRAVQMRAQIEAMLTELGDETVATKARGYVAAAKDDATALAEVANAVAMKLEESKTAAAAKGQQS